MDTGDPQLIQCIRSEIEKEGPISFARFMQQALYHPEHGYYSSGHCVIGREGDYFTNVSVGPLFGQLLAKQFLEIWERLGKNDSFVIVEQGAHVGQFARDVLQAVQQGAPEFFDVLHYRIIEPFRVLQERQSQTLHEFGDKIEWQQTLIPFEGVHFSNELLDAMPVRLIRGDVEKLVAVEGDKFVFVDRTISGKTSGRQTSARQNVFNQLTLEWLDNVAANLQRGYVIAIDYGSLDTQVEFSVQVRARHRLLDSPFEQIGRADITKHVDWLSVIERGRTNGLSLAGFTDQHHFLTGIISSFHLPDSPKLRRELQTLLHPEMLGRAFQVIAFEKNLAKPAQGRQLLQRKSHSTGKETERRRRATQPIHGIDCPPAAKRADRGARLAGFKFARTNPARW
jgi:SAM-dependent MidA family methyltransferase